jgi:indole-3-glycerol phosphate synthase
VDPNKTRIKDTRTLPETQGSPEADTILDRIVRTKREEIAALLARSGELERVVGGAPAPKDLAGALRRETEVAVMAEVKRRSPGAGPIRPRLDPAEVARAYEEAGASAVSVLTDGSYFGGAIQDLRAVRERVALPLFRKDFILHEVQLLEARAAGADGTLLIARILSDQELEGLSRVARSLGLSLLVEVHGEEELERALEAGSRVIGINNRDLGTFETSLDVTLELVGRIPPEVVVVSESGIRTAEEIDALGAAGVDAVLVGESLLRAPEPGRAVGELVGRGRVRRSHA